MEDETIYLLYEVQYLDKDLSKIDKTEIKNALKNILSSKYHLNILNLIYPTFDQKLFITINKSERVRLNREIKFGEEYNLKKVTEEFQIIYFELKNLELVDNHANISLNQKYAVKMMSMKDTKSSVTLNLFKGDTYQYQLIQDFLGNKVFREKERDEDLIETQIRSQFKNEGYVEEKQNNILSINIIQDENERFRYDYDNMDLGIEIYEGDLVEATSDVIVNAANRNLLLGGGVAESIKKRGGFKIQTECDDYLRKKNLASLQDGEVMHTGSYNMNNFEFIIHAVGPDSYKYKNDKNKCFMVLKATFYNVFEYANSKLKAKSIAVPLISSGIFGVPKDECCKQLYKALEEFIQKTNPQTRNLKYIRIPSIDSQTNNELIKNFKICLDEDNLLNKNETKIRENKKEYSADDMITHQDESPVKNVLPNHMVKNQDEQFDICIICEIKKKISKSLPNCKCKYCKDCESNYSQNGNKCNCITTF